MPTRAFVEVQGLLVNYFTGLGVYAGVSTKTPANLLNVLPFARIQRIGGVDTTVEDEAHIDIDTFAATEAAACDLAMSARESMFGLNNKVIDGSLIDKVRTLIAPVWVDWQDENVQRYVATYTLCVRATNR